MKPCLNLARLAGIILLAGGAARAGVDPIDMPAISADEAAGPQLRHTQELRPEEPTGTSVTLYGGVNTFQDGTLRVTVPGAPGELDGNNDSDLGEVAGLKIGYTWPGFDAIGSNAQADQTPQLLEPAIFADFFWTGYKFRADGRDFAGGSSLNADVNSYTFQVEPTLKFNLGPIRPYVGFGFGGTYTTSDNAQINVPGVGSAGLSGSSDDFDFSASGIAGVEYFFSSHWAVNLEYKYFYILDPTFHGNAGGSDVRYHLDGEGNHFFTGGVSYYF